MAQHRQGRDTLPKAATLLSKTGDLLEGLRTVPEEEALHRDLVRLSARGEVTHTILIANQKQLAQLAKNDQHIGAVLQKLTGSSFGGGGDRIRSRQPITSNEMHQFLDELKNTGRAFSAMKGGLTVNLSDMVKELGGIAQDNRMDVRTRRSMLKDLVTLLGNEEKVLKEVEALRQMDLNRMRFTKGEQENLSFIFNLLARKTAGETRAYNPQELQKRLPNSLLSYDTVRNSLQRLTSEGSTMERFLQRHPEAVSKGNQIRSGVMATALGSVGLGTLDTSLGLSEGLGGIASWKTVQALSRAARNGSEVGGLRSTSAMMQKTEQGPARARSIGIEGMSADAREGISGVMQKTEGGLASIERGVERGAREGVEQGMEEVLHEFHPTTPEGVEKERGGMTEFSPHIPMDTEQGPGKHQDAKDKDKNSALDHLGNFALDLIGLKETFKVLRAFPKEMRSVATTLSKAATSIGVAASGLALPLGALGIVAAGIYQGYRDFEDWKSLTQGSKSVGDVLKERSPGSEFDASDLPNTPGLLAHPMGASGMGSEFGPGASISKGVTPHAPFLSPSSDKNAPIPVQTPHVPLEHAGQRAWGQPYQYTPPAPAPSTRVTHPPVSPPIEGEADLVHATPRIQEMLMHKD